MADSAFLFTSGDVRRLISISQRQLSYWDKSGLACPSAARAGGSGRHRVYTLLDIIRMKVILRLRGAGVPLQRIRVALDVLKDLDNGHVPLHELEILSDGHRILIHRSEDQLLDAVASQFVLKFPLSDLLIELDTSGTNETKARARYPEPTIGPHIGESNRVRNAHLAPLEPMRSSLG